MNGRAFFSLNHDDKSVKTFSIFTEDNFFHHFVIDKRRYENESLQVHKIAREGVFSGQRISGTIIHLDTQDTSSQIRHMLKDGELALSAFFNIDMFVSDTRDILSSMDLDFKVHRIDSLVEKQNLTWRKLERKTPLCLEFWNNSLYRAYWAMMVHKFHLMYK